jgi:ABC-type multidrug transport system ATPase subunit
MSDSGSALAIETVGLRRDFGGFQALRGVDLKVPRNSVYGFVGPNGAGKTTTFSILCGFLAPTAGTARVLGHDSGDRGALGGRVGALPQDAPMPRATARAALRYWAELGGLSPADAASAANATIEMVGLTQAADRRASDFSHGMAKRVAIAQAFLGNPEVVLLDEPTSGLDPRSTFEVKQIIRSRTGRATIVISSHDLAQIEELCDSVAIIDRGRVVQQGSISELTGRGERIRITLADAAAPRALEALAGLDCASEAVFDPQTQTLSVHVKNAPAEDAIPRILRVVLDSGGRVVAVARGQRLEERVIELT